MKTLACIYACLARVGAMQMPASLQLPMMPAGIAEGLTGALMGVATAVHRERYRQLLDAFTGTEGGFSAQALGQLWEDAQFLERLYSAPADRSAPAAAACPFQNRIGSYGCYCGTANDNNALIEKSPHPDRYAYDMQDRACYQHDADLLGCAGAHGQACHDYIIEEKGSPMHGPRMIRGIQPWGAGDTDRLLQSVGQPCFQCMHGADARFYAEWTRLEAPAALPRWWANATLIPPGMAVPGAHGASPLCVLEVPVVGTCLMRIDQHYALMLAILRRGLETDEGVAARRNVTLP